MQHVLKCPFCNDPLLINKKMPHLRGCERHKLVWNTQDRSCKVIKCSDNDFIQESISIYNEWRDLQPIMSFAKHQPFTESFRESEVYSIYPGDAREIADAFDNIPSGFKLIQYKDCIATKFHDTAVALASSFDSLKGTHLSISKTPISSLLYFLMISHNINQSENLDKYVEAVRYKYSIVPEQWYYWDHLARSLDEDYIDSIMMYSTVQPFGKWVMLDQLTNVDMCLDKIHKMKEDWLWKCKQYSVFNSDEMFATEYPLLQNELFDDTRNKYYAKDPVVYIQSPTDVSLSCYKLDYNKCCCDAPGVSVHELKHGILDWMANCSISDAINRNVLYLLKIAVYMLHIELSNSIGSADELIEDFWLKCGEQYLMTTGD